MRPKALAAIIALAAISFAGSTHADDAASTGGAAVFRRLSAEQYRQIVADVFGATIKIGGRFEPDIREDGLLAVGSSRVSVTASGLEQYDTMARSIASQVVDETNRATLIPCKPASGTAPDEACAAQFLSRAGRLLYRRPLTEQELKDRVGVSTMAAKTLKNFYAGIQASLSDMLMSPQFLFRRETAEPDPDHAGQYRLDAFSKASQISFLLWNTAPDGALLAAAESGQLNDKKALAQQVDRLLRSPRLEAGVRAFFSDMLGFDEFETLAKDPALFPNFTGDVARDAQEQTLRTIVDLLVTRQADYRDLFTTHRTFLTPLLGSLYRIPVPDTSPNGTPDGWQPYEFPDGDPRAGILSQASFVALHSQVGRSSPTLRGKAVRTIILCQKVPDPPANVNFTVVQDTANPKYKTTRERVTAHRTEPACAGCHKIMDPLGLALENFDSAGAYRTTENAVTIDSSGELDGIKFDGVGGLGRAIHDYPAASSCLVNRLYSYAAGRPPAKGETGWMKALEDGFATDGHRLGSLLRRIATSSDFYQVSSSQTGSIDPPLQPNPLQESRK